MPLGRELVVVDEVDEVVEVVLVEEVEVDVEPVEVEDVVDPDVTEDEITEEETTEDVAVEDVAVEDVAVEELEVVMMVAVVDTVELVADEDEDEVKLVELDEEVVLTTSFAPQIPEFVSALPSVFFK